MHSNDIGDDIRDGRTFTAPRRFNLLFDGLHVVWVALFNLFFEPTDCFRVSWIFTGPLNIYQAELESALGSTEVPAKDVVETVEILPHLAPGMRRAEISAWKTSNVLKREPSISMIAFVIEHRPSS
jgi:hypothetical protein